MISTQPEGDITLLLLRWQEGDEAALDQLFPLIYDNLRLMADRHLRGERKNHTLQTTALVHEAYLRLCRQDRGNWQCRAQFMAIAARVMRRVLMDYARAKKTEKRGEGVEAFSLDEAQDFVKGNGAELLALDDALVDLEKLDVTQCRIVEMKFFSGLTLEEIAAVLSRSRSWVKGEWLMARAWLHDYLSRV